MSDPVTLKQQRRDRLVAIVSELAETTCLGEQHLALAVRGKKFAYYLDQHHGDGIVGVAFKAPTGEQESLIRADPRRFYVPAYVGSKGWVGLRLDLDDVDWAEVRELITEAYRLQAPQSLRACSTRPQLITESGSGSPSQAALDGVIERADGAGSSR